MSDYIDDQSGKLLNNTLVEKARARKFRSSVNLVSGRLWTNLTTRSCLAHDGLTSTRETKTNRATAVGWWCRSASAKQIGGLFSQQLPHFKLYESC